MAEGVFITLEGGEGTGKTTQQSMLVRRVKGMGREVLATREPGGTYLGRGLRRLLEEPGGESPTALAELLMFMADRAQHVQHTIGPALDQGRVVVCDRFIDSSEVYQARVRGMDLAWVRELNRRVCGGLWPVLTVVLDLEPRLGLQRVMDRQQQLGLGLTWMEAEDLEFHRRVRQGFLDQAAAEPGRVKVVAAGGRPEEVAEAVWSLVEPLLKGSGGDAA